MTEPGGLGVGGSFASEDALKEAREVILTIMRGRGGRGAMVRLMAAKMVLARDFFEQLTDEDLLAEVRRRSLARKAERAAG